MSEQTFEYSSFLLLPDMIILCMDEIHVIWILLQNEEINQYKNKEK